MGECTPTSTHSASKGEVCTHTHVLIHFVLIYSSKYQPPSGVGGRGGGRGIAMTIQYVRRVRLCKVHPCVCVICCILGRSAGTASRQLLRSRAVLDYIEEQADGIDKLAGIMRDIPGAYVSKDPVVKQILSLADLQELL